MVLGADAPVFKNDDENEQVVERKRLLEDVAGEELDRRLVAPPRVNAEVECQGEEDVETRPQRRLEQRKLGTVTGKDLEVEDEEKNHEYCKQGECGKIAHGSGTSGLKWDRGSRSSCSTVETTTRPTMVKLVGLHLPTVSSAVCQ